MSESHTEPRSSDRVNKPALPPFGGQITTASPILRPATDLRGRQTLPPFFGQLVRRGGPLPGARPQPMAVALPPAVATHFSPVFSPASPPTPTWDTPAMPVPATAAAVEEPPASAADADLEVPSEYSAGAEWAPPSATPVDVQAAPEDSTEIVEASAASSAAAVGTPAVHTPAVHTPAVRTPVVHVPAFDDTAEPELPTDPEYAVTAPPEPTGGYAAPPPPAPSEWTGESANDRQTLPPTLFADTPLGTPETVPDVDNEFPYDLSANVMSDDITDMFAEPYTTPPPVPAPETAAGQRKPARKTPVLGTPRVGYTPSSAVRAQMAARIGRRATPVLGSPAVTPMQTPVIRRTPMGGAIAAIEPAASDLIATPLPLASLSPLPMPVAVPAMENISASRAVAHALETVAARVRAGQIVVAGDVPVGDDNGSLAAGIAAALAALLGVQR